MSFDRTPFAGAYSAEAARHALAQYARSALIIGFLLFIAAGRYFSVGWFRR
jgi:hypothetical protein